MEEQKKRMKDITWSKMAGAYLMDLETFYKNIQAIRPQLDEIAGRTNYRKLTPKMISIIQQHLGSVNL